MIRLRHILAAIALTLCGAAAAHALSLKPGVEVNNSNVTIVGSVTLNGDEITEWPAGSGLVLTTITNLVNGSSGTSTNYFQLVATDGHNWSLTFLFRDLATTGMVNSAIASATNGLLSSILLKTNNVSVGPITVLNLGSNLTVSLSGPTGTVHSTGSGGNATLTTNWVTAVRSAYGGGGWDYASVPFGLTTSNLMTFTVVATSTSSSDLSALALATLQTNQQTRRIRTMLIPPVAASSLSSLRFITLGGDNTNDSTIVTIGRRDTTDTFVFTQRWTTAGQWFTNTLAAATSSVLQTISYPNWWIHADVFNSGTNSASASEVQAIWQ